MIRFESRHDHVSRRGRADARDVDLDVPRRRAVPRRRRDRRRASRRCSARSTGSCRTSPGARSPGGSPSTGATRATHPPRELADVVGVVGQDPLAGFVTDTVEDELAYGMEQLAVAARRDAQARRGDARPARDRRPARPAAARRSRAASSSASRSARCSPPHPRVLVLDEPTSALDPTAAEEVLARDHPARARPRRHGACIAEHRLERVVQYADRDRASCRATAPSEPATAGRDARGRARRAAGRRSSAGSRVGRRCRCRCATRAAARRPLRDAARRRAAPRPRRRHAPRRRPRLAARGIVVRYGDVVAVREVDLDAVRTGEVVALHGPQRLGQVVVAVGAARARDATTGPRCRSSGVDPATLAAARCAAPRRARAADAGRPALPGDGRGASARRPTASPSASRARRRALLDRIAPGIADDAHPRDLSRASDSRSCWRSSSRPRRGRAARRADARPRLRRQGRASAAILARARGAGPRGRRRDPRRRVRRRRRRPRRRDGRRRDRRRRPDRRGRRRVAGVRAAGRARSCTRTLGSPSTRSTTCSAR